MRRTHTTRSAFSHCSAGVTLVAVLVACRGTWAGADAGTATGTALRVSAGSAPHATTALSSLAAAPDRYLDRGDVTIRYRLFGPTGGTPILLLHGYTDRLEMWNGVADSLARDHRVIVPDVRGFGRSEPTDTLSAFGQAMVDDQFALLDALGARQVHVVGYSMGGLLAANMALREPARIASATFIAGAFFEDASETARVLAPYLDSLRTEAGLVPFFRYILPTWPDSLVQQAAQQYVADNDRHTLVRSLQEFPALALDWSLVRRSTVPAVAVVGTSDGVRTLSQRLASRWPGVRYLEADGADHADITTFPDALQAVRLALSMGREKGAF